MPYIPHTEADVASMLSAIGVDRIDELFSEIPSALRVQQLSGLSAGITEMELARLMEARAKRDEVGLCFIGAGAYEHHIPAAVWDLASRGEFMTAYTPYQAEASQGTLQVLYEYQTMMASLTGMDVSNASCYDGASALAEAVLMSVRLQQRQSSTVKRILMPQTVHPFYRRVVETIVRAQGIQCETVPYDKKSGTISLAALKAYDEPEITALILPFPNFFGALEDVDVLTDWAHAKKAQVIALCNPLALALLKAPGTWGSAGADIACGEAQPFGVPLASGGPYVGYLCCKMASVRQMPGRIVGRSVDRDGKTAYTLTLQAREQHIRRAKATSNICTNQGLLVTAATIYLSLMGPEGLRRVAAESHAQTRAFVHSVTNTKGVKLLFSSPYFHEVVLTLPCSVSSVLETMAARGVQAGFDLSPFYPELGHALLVCVTETKTKEDIDRYCHELQKALPGETIC